MAKWTIYHNPKCSKSRQTLALLKENGIDPQIIEYLKTPPDERELREIISKLDVPLSKLVRSQENSFKEMGFDLKSKEEVVKGLLKNPSLIERPIVIKDDRAVIGRPPESVKELF